jgi:hypothetical protein
LAHLLSTTTIPHAQPRNESAIKTTIQQAQPRNESAIKKPPSRKGNNTMNLLLKTAIPQGQLRNDSATKMPPSRKGNHAMNLPQAQSRNNASRITHRALTDAGFFKPRLSLPVRRLKFVLLLLQNVKSTTELLAAQEYLPARKVYC